ncbi:MAG TPA: peptidylprolyl isomerase [Candidatus Limnocylindrales bacterium]|nr:peptidylprolyl isomerase [Candidatus Limnocylindrales bacterium]
MKKFTLVIAAVLLVSAVALYADNIVDEIIARVNDEIITRSEYERAKTAQLNELKQQYPSDWQTRWAKQEPEVLRDMIDQQLLLEKGKELGITGETETVKRLNQMRQQMGLATMQDLEDEAKKQGVSFEDYKEQIRIGVVSQQVIGQEVGSKIHITNEEVQQFYNEHKKDLEGPEEVSLSEIMISTQPRKPETEGKDAGKDADGQPKESQPLPEDPAKVAEAEAKAKMVIAELKNGAKFDELAKKVSDGSTAAQGGPLGTFKKGELAKEFEDKTFSLKPGEFTDPIRTKQGFLILKVNAHRSAGVPPLSEVEDRMKEAIYSQKLEPAARAYLNKLRDQAYIDIRQGYVDIGASSNQGNKPVMVAGAGDPASHQEKSGLKKKKKFLIF